VDAFQARPSCASQSSLVLTLSAPVRPTPKPPRPQQIIAGFLCSARETLMKVRAYRPNAGGLDHSQGRCDKTAYCILPEDPRLKALAEKIKEVPGSGSRKGAR
jgi:hypothetical protein